MKFEHLVSTIARLFSSQSGLPDKFKMPQYTQLPLLAIDLELTDLNTEVAKVTSIGWVSGTMFDVDLASAYYQVVRAQGDLKQSPIFHGLSAKDIATGMHVKEQMQLLQAYTDTHVWVFHNASLDVRVLSRLWRLLNLAPVTISTIDTMLLQIYMMEKTHGFVPHGEVTLANSRAFYDLPSAPDHNALDDALATLTLLFAQFYAMDKSGKASLKNFKHTGAIKTFTLG